MTKQKKNRLTSLFNTASNANQSAKREQIKTAAVIVAIIVFALGFYWYTSRPTVHKKPVVHHFAGAFSDDVGLEYDHTRIQSLLNQLDTTNSKLNDLEEKETKATQDKNTKQQRNQQQVAKEQGQIKALQQSVTQLKAALAHQEKQDKQLQATHSNTQTQSAFSNDHHTVMQPRNALVNSLGIDDQQLHYPGLAPKAKRDAAHYVWAGSFANGYLLTGIIGDAGTNATKNRGTVAIRLTSNGTMPNGQTSHLKGCVVLGSTYGDLSSDSDVIHLETLSCAGKKYAFEKKVYGSVFDLDAMQDLRGIPVLKAKPILGYAAAAGLLAGIGDGISASGTNTSVTGSGVVQTPTSVIKSGLGQGISKPADKITDYLMSIANIYHPIVVAHAGRKVTVLFQAGFWIDKPQYQSMQSIGHHQAITQNTNSPTIPMKPNANRPDALTQQVAQASGAVMSRAHQQAQSAFNTNNMKLGQAFFSPMAKEH